MYCISMSNIPLQCPGLYSQFSPSNPGLHGNKPKSFNPYFYPNTIPKILRAKQPWFPIHCCRLHYTFFVIWPGAPQWGKLRLPDLREQSLSWPSGQWKMGQLGTLLRGLTSLHGPCAAGSVDWSSKDFLITSSSPTVVSRQMKVLIWESCKCNVKNVCQTAKNRWQCFN